MYKLSPSDFAYLYADCKYCYYQKAKYGVVLPSIPMPGIFSTINSKVQGTLVGNDLHDLSSQLPEGIVVKQEGFVESKKIPNTNLYIKGKYDLLVQKPDGSCLLIDFKLSQAHEEKIEKYKTQLYSYKYALENPSFEKPVSISQLGLVIMYPDIVRFENGKAVVDFPPKWMEIPIDEKSFFSFAKEVDALLSGPTPPVSDSCKWCQYRKKFNLK